MNSVSRRLARCRMLLVLLLAWPSALSAQAPLAPAAVTRRAAAIRLPLLAGGLLTEAAAITSDRNLPYLGVGYALQEQWRTGGLVGASELALMSGEHLLRRRLATVDLARFPAQDDSAYWRRGSGVSATTYARYQAAEFAHHTTYYLRMSEQSLAWRLAWRRRVVNGPPLDSASPWRLLRAPATWSDLRSAPVLIPITLAAGSAFLAPCGARTLRDADSLRVLGLPTGRVRGALLSMGFEAATLLSTAVGEEAFFRGMVQTEVTQRAGATAGLAASTATFALFHVPKHGVTGSLIAGAAGVYLGERMRRTGNLRELVAMHFWIDFLPTAINIVRNPRSARAVDAIRWR